MASQDWTVRFEIPVPAGRAKLLTLSDARAYILALTPAEQKKPEWQAATHMLLQAANSGGNGVWMMMLRIAMLRGIGGSGPPTPTPKGGPAKPPPTKPKDPKFYPRKSSPWR